MEVNLTPELERLVRDEVAAGRYGDADEVVRDALRRLLEDNELQALKLERLREEIARGDADIAAGRVIAFDDVGALRDHILSR
jgi:antitoxin ParD1/3/4